MRSDISPAKKYANWDTVLVLEEMEAEFDNNCDVPNSRNDDNGPVPKKQHKVVSTIFTGYFIGCLVFVSFKYSSKTNLVSIALFSSSS